MGESLSSSCAASGGDGQFQAQGAVDDGALDPALLGHFGQGQGVDAGRDLGMDRLAGGQDGDLGFGHAKEVGHRDHVVDDLQLLVDVGIDHHPRVAEVDEAVHARQFKEGHMGQQPAPAEPMWRFRAALSSSEVLTCPLTTTLACPSRARRTTCRAAVETFRFVDRWPPG